MVGQVVAAIKALAGSEDEIPDPFKMRVDFDIWLNSPLEENESNREQRELEEALGIGGR